MAEARQIRFGGCGASYPIPAHGQVLRCPYCGQTEVGGAGALHEAQAYGSAVGVTARCGHCREHLIPSQPLIDAGLSQARYAHRQAALRLGQEERANDPAAHETFLAEYELAVAVGLVMLLQIGVGVSMGTSGDVTTAVALIGAALVIVGLPLGLFLYGRPRIKPLRAPVRALAAQLGGVVVDGDDAVGAWLDAHWPAPFSLKDLRRSPFLGVIARVHGYPALILVRPLGKRSRRHAATVALIAGDAPQPNPAAPAAQQEAAVIGQAGFETQVTEAGVTLTARPDHAHQLYRAPTHLLNLATVVGHGARFAAAAGSVPVN